MTLKDLIGDIDGRAELIRKIQSAEPDVRS